MTNDDINDFMIKYRVRDIQTQHESEPVWEYAKSYSMSRGSNVVIHMDYYKFRQLVEDTIYAHEITDRNLQERLLHKQYPSLAEVYAHYKTLLALMQHAT
jgi:hypothetical protein